MTHLSKHGLSHEAEKLQAFVRYRLPMLLEHKEDWWTYGDLNHIWRSAEDKSALEFQSNVHLLEVVEELNRGRDPPRYEIKATPPSYWFRQSPSDAIRKRVDPGKQNGEYEASKCICRAAKRSGNVIGLVEAVSHLWQNKFDRNVFTHDYVQRNCVNWARNRLSMRTDAQGLVRLEYIHESERHAHGRARRNEMPAQQPAVPYMSSSSTARPWPQTTVADAADVSGAPFADYVITGQAPN